MLDLKLDPTARENFVGKMNHFKSITVAKTSLTESISSQPP